MKIGTSLGKCVKSILAGEVKEEEVVETPVENSLEKPKRKYVQKRRKREELWESSNYYNSYSYHTNAAADVPIPYFESYIFLFFGG